MPLAEAGVTKWIVRNFWAAQEFDLGLPNINGETPHGNCDLCYKKKAQRVMSLIRERPERAVWWAQHEREAEKHATGDGARFRNDRASYAQMMNFAVGHHEMRFDADEPDMTCLCGD